MREHLLTAGALSLLLLGCGGKKDRSDVPQAAQAGHRVDLGLDNTRKGQLSDQDLVEVRAQLHRSTMSSIRAQDAVAAMRMEEERSAAASSVAEIDQALENLRALEQKLLARRAELEAKVKAAPEAGK